MSGDLIAVDLNEDERALLSGGLVDWFGPARATEALAKAMGFASKAELADEGGRIARAIRDQEPLSERDWTRALLSAELNTGSNVLGTGWGEWTAIHGGQQADWASALDNLQHKVPWSRKHLFGNVPEDEDGEDLRPELGGEWVTLDREGNVTSRYADWSDPE